MKLIVGLGNPGDRYEDTRHNVGFEIVEGLAGRCGASLAHDKRLNARVGKTRLGGDELWLVQPLSYMNLSGPVVARVVRERAVALEDLLVISDDFHLPLGKLRVRLKGSAGGHNGLKSLIGALGSQEFARMRVGIGEPPSHQPVEDWVLRRFKPAERPVIAESVDTGVNCAEDWAVLGPAAAMNKYNG